MILPENARPLCRLFDRPVRTGERIAKSPLTGNRYRVTRWFDYGDGRITAIQKELIEEDGGGD